MSALQDITNLTPHPVNILVAGGSIEIPSSGSIRLNENVSEIASIAIYTNDECSTHVGRVPLLFITFDAGSSLVDWPEKDNHFYIVSALVANAYPDRKDFLMVAKTVRDDEGRIKGCTALASATGDLS